MDIIHGKNLTYEELTLKHRGSGLSFKHLFFGEENTPENYMLTIGRQTIFYSPIHRHNFDQFRYAYRGDVSIAPDLTLKEGELCYHPEGVHYGPQNDVSGERDVLVLQFGGVSGQGYLNWGQIETAQEVLKKMGRFEGGRFLPDDGGEVKDGYEALYETSSGRKLEYPESAFDSVVVSKPESEEWVQWEGLRGVFVKVLGVYTERKTRAEMIKIEDGEVELSGEDAIQLLFVLRGTGKAGDQALETESAVRLSPGTAVVLSSDSDIQLIRFVLPMLRH